MRTLAIAAALCAAGYFGAPAHAQQALRKDFSWEEMRAELIVAGVEVTKDGVAGDQRYLSAKAKSGLVFAVYGAQCDNKEITQRCTGADIISSFTLKDPAKIHDVLDMIDFAALGDYKGDDGRFKVSRYVIFDGGITHENLQSNLEVFLALSNQIWDKLDDAELLQ
ncbi:MAG TPA: hypothetical protein VGO52_11460 [Hyphomonadaceae bacterium]|jgi:hypothetical protein|nr:hypothetical protein [Hyphomonadaceae bacterium]